MSTRRRVAIIGVDCLTPQLLFDRYADELPAFRKLRENGAWGTLRSTVPPITIPAWMCMATSQDPGQLGIYGFRNRTDHSYGKLAVADASWLRSPSLWQLLSRKRRSSIVLGVPLTFPARPIQGALVSGIPVPDGAEVFTAPASLRAEIEAMAGGSYPIDASEFRTTPPDELLAQIDRLRETRFDVAEGLATSREWDLLFMVEMGVDRLHHAFWAHSHPDHPSYVPDSPYANAIRDYYRALDARVGRLVEKLGEETAILVVSDHGARTMVGGLRINEWLVQQGLLTLKRRPEKLSRLTPDMVDWSKTTAWADGGYYARVFLNVAGREPEGTVAAESLAEVRAEVRAKLETMPGPDGKPLGNRVFVPQEVYRACNGIPPDLILYPGGLSHRANATVFPEAELPDGAEAVFAAENDTGVDGANHAEDGVLIYRPAAGVPAPAQRQVHASIYDVAPTVLRLLGEEIPEHMIGEAAPFAVPRD